VRRVMGPWNAAALPEIMAEAVEESKRCVPERSSKAEQQACNWAASPEPEAVELRNSTEA